MNRINLRRTRVFQTGRVIVLLLVVATGPAFALTGATALCGNQVVDDGEDCDDGGLCAGGENAGAACRGETECRGSGICTGPRSLPSACTNDLDCGDGGHCRRCLPFGGDGCAANCTDETEVAADLIAGQVDSEAGAIAAGTSGVGLLLPSELSVLNLLIPIQGTVRLTVGRERAGEVPVVIRERDFELPAVDLAGLGVCLCARGRIAKTCGGFVLEADGETRATDCSSDESLCATLGKPPCAAVNGLGNAMAGVVGCASRRSISAIFWRRTAAP